MWASIRTIKIKKLLNRWSPFNRRGKATLPNKKESNKPKKKN